MCKHGPAILGSSTRVPDIETRGARVITWEDGLVATGVYLRW